MSSFASAEAQYYDYDRYLKQNCDDECECEECMSERPCRCEKCDD